MLGAHSSSRSAEKPPSNEKPSRDIRLERFENDDNNNLCTPVHTVGSKPQTLKDKLGQHFSKLPSTTAKKH
ncbi:hypothetical protein CSAL01_07932 [Colletotrichum salicis]|uniref:Uncharacterized protein n=1 Tax=Colletotrichum salicis TaxID=1209931 RepID=A0A135T687_9PEZI|nr:hypothetical protein CSAL01_07932 [Colletotrichum salicis]